MSTPEWSQVVAGQSTAFPQAGGNQVLGPFTLYELGQGQTAMFEAVTFVASGAVLLDFDLQFRVELCDPSSNILFQQITPTFNFD